MLPLPTSGRPFALPNQEGKNRDSKGERNRRFRSLWASSANCERRPPRPELPFPLPRKICVFAGRRFLSRPRPFLARRREVLTGASSPPIIANPGNGSGPRRSRAVSGSCWPPLRISLSLAGISACLSPRFYPHSAGPAGPLLDGVPRFGGALLSKRRSRSTKTRNAVCPVATVMLYFDASQCPFLHLRDSSQTRMPTLARPYAATFAFVSASLLFRSGSYASPLTHSRCSSTANFRATATTARFLAFFPPRWQIRCP